MKNTVSITFIDISYISGTLIKWRIHLFIFCGCLLQNVSNLRLWVEYNKATPPSNGRVYYYASNLTSFNHWLQVKTGSDQTALCLCIFRCSHLCFVEHPEDKQLPVRPATGNPSSICYHPQFSPTGPGLLKHAHLLQPCWWVWSPNTVSSAGTVCSALHRFLVFSLWYWYWG